MYEDNNTFEDIMERTLAKVATDVDKREGSVIYNALAPTNEEIAYLYTLLDAIIENGFADTAERDYLIQRCKERGIYPDEATCAILKAEFNMEIPIGNRFNLGELNYVAIAFIEQKNVSVKNEDGETEVKALWYYQLQCEEAGTEGNTQFGVLEAIDFVDTNMEGSIVELLVPAEDEEDTEALRERYLNSFSTTPFGGNQDDYKEEVGKLDGVGGVKIIPVWDGGGTVKLIIINSNFEVASEVLVANVQNAIDPPPQGKGAGLAPIGHTVTVVSCRADIIPISISCTLEDGYTWDAIREQVTANIEAYFLEIRKRWANEDNSIVRVSQVENRILSIEGVIDVQNTKLNNRAENFTCDFEAIPVLGVITNA